jgi:uncharacterized membrane protein YebE (DUF533 family)
VFDAKKLLDAFLGAAAQIGQPPQPGAGQAPGAGQGVSAELPPRVNQTVQQVTGQSPDQLLEKAKGVLAQNPGLAQAAAIGLAGLLFGKRKPGRGVPGGLARLGGLAVIGGLAYKAFQNRQAGKTLLDGTAAGAAGQIGGSAGQGALPGSGASSQGGVGGSPSSIPQQGGSGQGASPASSSGGAAAQRPAASPPSPVSQGGAGSGTAGAATAPHTPAAPGGSAGAVNAIGGATYPGTPASQATTASTLDSLEAPQGSSFHPVSHTEDDALLFLRTMVAAAAADGQIDESERTRITKGLSEAGIDPEATRWLEREMAAPADVEELAAGVTTPEKAAQVYAAARIAIDPDTIQEREFLRQLAEALDLDQGVRAQIDSTAGDLKVNG